MSNIFYTETAIPEPETPPPVVSPELQRAISQFQQVLWTPNLPRAVSILQSHPEVLSHQNRIGFLPLHIAIKCTRSAYRSEMIKLIIEEGIKHNVGGPDARGGLLVPSTYKNRTGLCLLVVGDDKTDILSYLINRDPPLLTPRDVIDYDLLHCAAGDPFLFNDRFDTLRYLMDFCPQALASPNAAGDLPIHYLCKQPGYALKIFEMFLNEGILNGVFLEENGEGEPLLARCLVEHIIPVLRSIERDNVPILQGVFGVVTKTQLRTVIDTIPHFKAWCYVRDNQGRLPIHIASECGLQNEEMEDVIEANVNATGEIDPVTGLYPFLLAACSAGKKGGCDLASIYRLARYNPNCVGFQTGK